MTILGPVLDVRPLFSQERQELLALLRSLSAADWSRETVCPGWDVHDVVGHVLNDYLRRISGSRDGFAGATFANDETLPGYLARTNDEFVRAARQCSPELMIELLAHLGPELDRLWGTFDLTAPAALDVSWAGPGPSPAWLDIARDYTEFWVHQQQIRDAVGRPGADRPELAHPVLDTFLRALPHALREVARPHGTAVRVVVPGPSGGTWHAMSDDGRWRMADDETDPVGEPAATITIRPDDLWRLATRGITVAEARRRADAQGDHALIDAATALLAVVA
ncbi:maleylpyruvate isomerase family mycothiol-dependent enzyme [Saccharopolyspora sp. 5N102]|uniref:maleylpyruvate isomerase family mycothiol-dependent enzyme n=1 Tax=Saccharopolyspora sp. 5N102 TaxID=3375155 RepID=UPI003799E15C